VLLPSNQVVGSSNLSGRAKFKFSAPDRPLCYKSGVVLFRWFQSLTASVFAAVRGPTKVLCPGGLNGRPVRQASAGMPAPA
jgi:hypothetical protein